jgi:hypothetical protein
MAFAGMGADLRMMPQVDGFGRWAKAGWQHRIRFYLLGQSFEPAQHVLPIVLVGYCATSVGFAVGVLSQDVQSKFGFDAVENQH